MDLMLHVIVWKDFVAHVAGGCLPSLKFPLGLILGPYHWCLPEW